MLPQRLINGCLEQGQADRGKAAATTQARLVDLEDAPDRRRPRDPTMFNLAIGSKLRGSNLAHERPLCARSGLSRLSECVKMVARHNETLATERRGGRDGGGSRMPTAPYASRRYGAQRHEWGRSVRPDVGPRLACRPTIIRTTGRERHPDKSAWQRRWGTC